MSIRRDTSQESAARFFALRAKTPISEDPQQPAQRDRRTLQQVMVGTIYRYLDVDTGREYSAVEARSLASDGPVVTRYIDGGVSFLTRYIDERPGSG